MAGVLEGLKVIEMGHVEAGPTAGAWLADWGAEVIRVEPPSGSFSRRPGTGTSTSTQPIDSGDFLSNLSDWHMVMWGVHQLVLNRNKKSLALDLKKEPGREIIHKLVQRADVFLSNYQRDSLRNLKLDYATLSQLNPGLIYAIISAYGPAGPDKDEGGIDNGAWARSGMNYIIGEEGSPPPKPPSGIIDRGMAAPHLVAGILAALLHRDKTGKGQELEVSLFQSAVWGAMTAIQNVLMGGKSVRRDREKAPNPIANIYRTKDNRAFQLGSANLRMVAKAEPDQYWLNFCRAIERPELGNDPRFNNAEAQAQNCEELVRIIDEVIASKTMAEWEKRFTENNCTYVRIQSPEEVINDPQALANDFFAELTHPLGKMKVVATPVKFFQNPASVKTPSPAVGQHNEEIILDLGYSRDDIAQLKEQGVIQ